MRTTLTLDDDVARLVEDAIHRDRASMKSVVNDALRRALAPALTPPAYRVRVHSSAVRAGIDPQRLNQLVDEVGIDDTASRLG